MIVLILLFLIASVFVGYVGRHSRLGFWGVLAASVLFTPLLVFVILIFLGQTGGPRRPTNAQDTK